MAHKHVWSPRVHQCSGRTKGLGRRNVHTGALILSTSSRVLSRASNFRTLAKSPYFKAASCTQEQQATRLDAQCKICALAQWILRVKGVVVLTCVARSTMTQYAQTKLT